MPPGFVCHRCRGVPGTHRRRSRGPGSQGGVPLRLEIPRGPRTVVKSVSYVSCYSQDHFVLPRDGFTSLDVFASFIVFNVSLFLGSNFVTVCVRTRNHSESLEHMFGMYGFVPDLLLDCPITPTSRACQLKRSLLVQTS